jgi:hypothetical protein
LVHQAVDGERAVLGVLVERQPEPRFRGRRGVVTRRRGRLG